MPPSEPCDSYRRRRILTALGAAVTVAGCGDTGTSQDTEDSDDSPSTESDADDGSEESLPRESQNADDSNDSSTTESQSSPEPGEMVIADVDVPLTVDYDQDVALELIVQNPGDESVSQSVKTTVDDDVVNSESVTLAGGDNEMIEFTIPADATFDGEYDIHITTSDDEHTRTLFVENPNPYGKETLVVGLEQETSARQDIQNIVTDALEYWEEHSTQYVGYPIEYEYRPNSLDTDVKIRLVEDIDACGDHSGPVAGCAPLVTNHAPDTADIEIVAGYRQEWMTTTLKHELGHTLGLDHDDEPAHIMSNEIEDRIPNYDELRTALDTYIAAFDPYESGLDEWETAMDEWEKGNFATVESAAVAAHNDWAESVAGIEAAESIARDLNEHDAQQLLGEAYMHVESLRLAADSAIEMAREAAKTGGNPEPYREAVNHYLDESGEYSFHDSDDVATALGLAFRTGN